MTLTQPEAHLMSLDAYVPLLGARELDELRALAAQLSGRTVQMVNSTAMGGGVAEILNRLIPLIQELGLRPRWDVITGKLRGERTQLVKFASPQQRNVGVQAHQMSLRLCKSHAASSRSINV